MWQLKSAPSPSSRCRGRLYGKLGICPFFIGSFLARIVIAFLFIPAFYHYNCTSIYEFLQYRFGPATQIAGSILFFITRLLASGVRLMVACLAVSILIGWPIIPTILLFSVICILYIAWGGIKAVVWTNVVQALTFTLAGVVAIGFLLWHIDGGGRGCGGAGRRGGETENLQLGTGSGGIWTGSRPEEPVHRPQSLCAGDLERVFRLHGGLRDDQETMQRVLTVETRRESQKTMLLTPIGSFLVMVIFLIIGACLYAFYAQNPACPAGQIGQNFSAFYRADHAAVMRGLMLAAIVMRALTRR